MRDMTLWWSWRVDAVSLCTEVSSRVRLAAGSLDRKDGSDDEAKVGYGVRGPVIYLAAVVSSFVAAVRSESSSRCMCKQWKTMDERMRKEEWQFKLPCQRAATEARRSRGGLSERITQRPGGVRDMARRRRDGDGRCDRRARADM